VIEAVQTGECIFRDHSRDTGLQITLPDPDENDMLHVFFLDPESEESVVNFLDSLREIYRERGEEIATKILGTKTSARAVCGALVQEGKLVRVGDGVYRLAEC
jgi:hypothetical protein